MTDYEVLPDTTGLKIRVFGESVNELFKNALVGMFQLSEPKVSGCHKDKGRIHCPELPMQRTLELSSEDELELLLVEFLNEALYLSDIHNEVYLDTDVNVSTDDMHVNAVLKGITVQGFGREIKSATFEDMAINFVDDIYSTDIVFDI